MGRKKSLRKSKKLSRKYKKHSKTKKINKRRIRRFSYSHNQGPRLINAHMDDGILLADNAFNWMGNPEARAENA